MPKFDLTDSETELLGSSLRALIQSSNALISKMQSQITEQLNPPKTSDSKSVRKKGGQGASG